MTEVYIEFENDSVEKPYKDGISKDALNSVYTTETELGLALCVFTIDESIKQSKQRIVDYSKSIISMMEKDLEEYKEFCSNISDEV